MKTAVCALAILSMGLVHVLAAKPPNALFIFTDDQDFILGGSTADVQPNLYDLVVRQGVSFSQAAPAVPVCCPSRSSTVTGRYQHNTRVLNNSIPGNCAGQDWQKNAEMWNFGYLMSEAGYRTQYIGKYLNQAQENGAGGIEYVPRGWERDEGATIGGWMGLKGNSRYLDYTISNNGKAEVHGNDFATDYFPDLIANRTMDFIKYNHAQNDKPFFAVAAFPSCHQSAIPSPEYANSFPGVQAPRIPNYNLHREDRHWFVRDDAYYGFDANAAAWTDLLARRRHQTLSSVDAFVKNVVQLLTDIGELENTYIIYSSDHGYHLGNFKMELDKRQLYETDARIPFFVRGPGTPKNLTISDPVSLVDVTPTLVDIAGGHMPSGAPPLDGESILPKLRAAAQVVQKGGTEQIIDATDPFRKRTVTAVNLAKAAQNGLLPGATVRTMIGMSYHGEHNNAGYNPNQDGPCKNLGEAGSQLNCYAQEQYQYPPFFNGTAHCSCQDVTNNTYWCNRYVDPAQDTMYCNFTTGFVEYYDLKADFYQINNTADQLSPLRRQFYAKNLDNWIACAGESCGRSTFNNF